MPGPFGHGTKHYAEIDMADPEDLATTALNALAASPGGTMTLSDLTAHLDTRLGSTAETARDARDPENEQFREQVRHLVSSEPGSDSLVERGLATAEEAGALITITEAGRRSIGR